LNVLITSASRKVSLVRAFQSALQAEGGGTVIAVDASSLSPALYIADKHFIVPRSGAPGFVNFMIKLCSSLKVDLLIPTRDEELPIFAKSKERFAKVGTRVMVADKKAVETCQDKKQFIQFCQKHGFATPRGYDKKESKKLRFPVFVKPRYGKGGMQAMRVNSGKELEIAMKNIPDAIIQEYVQAPEFTIDLFANFAGKIISVVPRERIAIFSGESFISKTSKNPLLIEESVRMANALHLVGHNTIQCFLDKGKVKFIEVNPRFGGAANLGFAAGAMTPLFLIKLIKGEALQPRVGDFKDNYVMMRYTEDLLLPADDLTRRKFDESNIV
jgi:carbamoyl-phosphate synthase large subunit